MRHSDQNLIGFHNRLKYHRRLYLGRHYRQFRPSLNQTTRLHHVGRYPLHLSDRHHRYRYLMHLELHRHLSLLAYWLYRSGQNLIGFHAR